MSQRPDACSECRQTVRRQFSMLPFLPSLARAVLLALVHSKRPWSEASYSRNLVTACGSGGGLGLRDGRIADDLDPISELHTLDQFWQLIVAVDPAPTLLGALG